MLYSILIYDSETVVDALDAEENAARIAQHVVLQKKLSAAGGLGPVARLAPSAAAVTLRPGPAGRPLVLDGPYAETKEQLVGFYVIDCDSLQAAIDAASLLPLDTGTLEIRPVSWFKNGKLSA